MPHPYKILNLQGYFSCKTIEKISRLRRENLLNWGEGQLPPKQNLKWRHWFLRLKWHKFSTNDVISKEKVTNKTKFSSRLRREIENIRRLQLETATSKVWKDGTVMVKRFKKYVLQNGSV